MPGPATFDYGTQHPAASVKDFRVNPGVGPSGCWRNYRSSSETPMACIGSAARKRCAVSSSC